MSNKYKILETLATKGFSLGALALSMLVISFSLVKFGVAMSAIVSLIPAFLILMGFVISNSFISFTVLFTSSYFIIAMIRYANLKGVSVLIDVLIAVTFLTVIFSRTFAWKINKPKIVFAKGLIFAASLWLVYCSVEILNPRAMVSAWILSRGLGLYFLAISTLTMVVFTDYGKVRSILIVMSILTLVAVAKGMMQEYMGFDWAERAYLNAGSYKTHLLASGTRYFSIFASAGIYGALMGHALVVFGVLTIYEQSKKVKIYFGVVTLFALYGLLMSGTRGALAVPFAGFFLFIMLSKRIQIMIPTIIIFIGVYVLLAFTTIGQSNAQIRRMRSAFDPNEPSLMVRKENQKLFKEYLADKPFGEGLGLSGVDAQPLSMRFTTSIATDSWYVKIWVETGIVGLLLHIGIFIYVLIHGSYIIFFQVNNKQLRGVLIALLSGVFGLLVSSYGNQILGQFPIVVIVYMSIALVFMGPYFDKQLSDKQQQTA